MKQHKFFHTTRYILMAVLAIIVIVGIVVAIPSVQKEPMVAEALTAANTVLPSDIQNIFTDYTLTALNSNYDTFEELAEFKESLGDRANTYKTYLERAEDIIYGNVRFNGMREFSTEQDALNPIDQYGNLERYQRNTLKWPFEGNVTQVTGIYGISQETFTVYVEAEDNAKLPSLILEQSKGYVNNSWRISVELKRGINTFTFPFATSTGEKGGVVYIFNPYTRTEQGGEVSLYVEGGGFYPVYRSGDDEDAFVGQVNEFYELRQQNGAIPDIADLLPDYALLTITATSVYDAYVTKKVSPAANMEYWNNYFTKTFAFNGMTANPENPEEESVQPYVRIHIKHMYSYSGGAAYTTRYHIGIYGNEDLWLANYTDTWVDEYKRFACIGHEIGHVLDTEGRKVAETTNNMNAVNAYFRILGYSMSSPYLPFTRAQGHLFSDYTIDYLAYDDGRILYRGDSNYDHNYMMWWCLESVFPNYWSKLNNCYRYDTSATSLNANERMVYYSSLVTGVDLSDYFERWGMYLSGQSKFKVASASTKFNSLMKDAISSGEISKDYSHFWYADVKQMDFTLSHSDTDVDERKYIGTPSIESIRSDGSTRTLEFSLQTDPNHLGYEIYSSEDGVNFKIAGFTYSTKFTDYNEYATEPTYKVRGVNRYFNVSEFSTELKGPTEEASEDVCRIGSTRYKDLKSAVVAARTSTDKTIYLLSDCVDSAMEVFSGEVTITVDSSVKHDITITHATTAHYFFGTNGLNATLNLKGRADARIILDGVKGEYVYPAIYASMGTFYAEYVVISNYTNTSTMYGGAVCSEDATLTLKNCLIENCASRMPYSAVLAGSKSTTLQNCEFTGISTLVSNTYKAAIGFFAEGSGSLVLDSCSFEDNERADIYVNGNYTFKGHVPTAVVDFADGYNYVALSDCENASSELDNLTLTNNSYYVSLNSGRIDFVERKYTLTFKLSEDNVYTFDLLGSNEFVFGDEDFETDDDSYIDTYLGEGSQKYSAGDKIIVNGDMTFTVIIKQYLKLTLKYKGDGGVKEQTVQLKHNGSYYLPRFDDDRNEIVKWESNGTVYWAGAKYIAQEDDTLYAVYPATFTYTFVCRNEVVNFGYAVYNEQIVLTTPSIDSGDFRFWRTVTQLFDNVDKYSMISDVVFIAVYSDEEDLICDLSKSEIVLTQTSFQYDGQAQMPDIEVTINGEPVSPDKYSIVYRQNINVGTATVTVEAKGYYVFGSQSTSFEITALALTKSDIDVAGLSETLVYSGYQTSQAITIAWKGATLELNQDYTIRYDGDRVNVGTVNLIVQFKGNFSGEETFSYQIVRADRSNFSVRLNSWTYGQAANTPSVWNYGNESGSVAYSYSLSENGQYDTDAPKNAGTYYVKAEMSASSNYNAATATAQFTIYKATLSSVPSNFTVDSRKKTLSDVADKLLSGWHWVDETLPLNLGTNRAYAEYEDMDNYTNPRVQVTITVTEYTVDIAKAKVTVDGACVYNGSAHTPSVKVELNGEVLTEYTDYTLTYSNNINAGTASVTVLAAGEYNGSQVVEFTIEKQDISDLIELRVNGAELVNGVYKIKYDENYHQITAKVDGLEGVTVTLDRSSVKNVGEYRIKAQISSDNYCGTKEFAVSVYADSSAPDESAKPNDGDKAKGEDDDKLTIVVGAIIGVVILAAICGTVYYFIRSRRK